MAIRFIPIVLVMMSAPIITHAQFSPRQLAVGNGMSSNFSTYGAVGDLDNDGFQDLVDLRGYEAGPASAAYIAIEIFYSTGDHDFADGIEIHRVETLHSIVLADVDNNGWVDIIITESAVQAQSPHTSTIFYNYGPAGFQSVPFAPSGQQNLSIFNAGDFNLDGHTDLFALNTTAGQSQAILFRGNQGGSFTALSTLPTSYPFTRWPEPLGMDMNNDGTQELLLNNGAYVILGADQNFVLSSQMGQSTGPSSYRCIWGDVDGDGDVDMITLRSNGSSYAVDIRLNDGQGIAEDTILSPFMFSVGMQNMHLIAFDDNGDGAEEILVAHEHPSNFSNRLYRLQLVGGTTLEMSSSVLLDDVAFVASVLSTKIRCFRNVNGQAFYLAATDVGYEVVTVDAAGNLTNTHKLISHQRKCGNPLLMDVDGDGVEDILLSFNDTVSFAKGHGTGQFDHPVSLMVGSESRTGHQFWLADLDLDGDTDILVRRGSASGAAAGSGLYWIRNFGAGTYSYHPLGSIQFGFNDLVIGNTGFGSGPHIYGSHGSASSFRCLNDGAGNFTFSSTTGGSPSGVKRLLLHDIDEDGIPDLIRLTATDVLPGIASGISATDIVVGDIDGDGFEDFILTANDLNAIVWIRKLGPSEYAGPEVLVEITDYAWSLNVEDLNGDGMLDMVYVGSPHGTQSSVRADINYLLGLEGGGYGPKTVVDVSKLFRNVNLLDVDNDGVKDILREARFSAIWYKNFLASPFRILGHTFHDADGNGQFDAEDLPLPQVNIGINSGMFGFSMVSGMYQFTVDSGSYSVFPQFNTDLWTLSTDSLTYQVSLDEADPVFEDADFGFVPNGVQPIASAEITVGFPRCDQVINHWITVLNEGNTVLNGSIRYDLSPSTTFVSSDPMPDSIVGNTLYFSMSELLFGNMQTIQLQVQMPGFSLMGTNLTHEMTVFDEQGDTLDHETHTHGVLCSYDPNDKLEDTGFGEQGYVLVDGELEYTVRFQNTGNDTAYTVLIRDELSSSLQWPTLQPIAWSHPVQTTVSDDGEVTFLFENIYLVDSATNPTGSQGFVKFRIAIDSDVQPGDQIFNTAGIYFDQNSPIITNTTVNTVFQCGQPVGFTVVSDSVCAELVPVHAWVNLWGFGETHWYQGDSLLADGDLFIGNLNLDQTSWLRLEITHPLCPVQSDSAHVQLSPLNVPQIVLSTLEVCEGEELTLTDASTQDYVRTWRYDGIEVHAETLETVAQISMDTIVLIATNGVCPPGSDTAVVTVYELSQAHFNVSSDTVCRGVVIWIDSEVVGEYEWFVNGSAADPPVFSDFSSDTAGVFIIQLNAIQPACPVDSMAVNVVVVDPPVIFLSYDSIGEVIIASPEDLDSYLWYFNSLPLPDESNTISSYGNGAYHVIVSDTYGCISESGLIELAVGIGEQPVESYGVNPNPNDGNFTITWGSSVGVEYVELYDARGRMVHSQRLNPSSDRFDVSTNLTGGIYMLNMVSRGGVTAHRLMIAP